ncbi:MAG: glycosyltransferase family 2 protein [bacterium]|nr:glycosyltransferase family 2 protein [bacterium]
MKIPCSIPILSLNAKRQLEKSLPVLSEYFDDVFLIDGNSTDGTQEYARSLGIRVERQKNTEEPNIRITDFRATRIKSWQMCRYDWILVLDSDEFLTSDLIQVIRDIVECDNKSQTHLVRRHVQLLDGTVVDSSVFYSSYFVRLFARSSGVTLADRKVHERFIIPPHCTAVQHEEAIICPEPDPVMLRKRSHRYLALETETIPSPTWKYLWKWILWYNLRSFFGQLYRVVVVDVSCRFRGKKPLPWAYNCVFLEYRLLSIWYNIGAWFKKRNAG